MSDPGRVASPPCLACEIAPGYFDPLAVDPEQVRDVTRWRKAERARLLADRQALSASQRRSAADTIAANLDTLLDAHFPNFDGLTISAWWPIKAELNLRLWLESLLARGARVALPMVVAPAAPLAFRLWTPDSRMVLGFWKIPVPADGPAVVPNLTLAPLVGWDPAGFRLGYGGGYFDRTLAVLSPRPMTIGIGLQSARLANIFPQPHDIALDVILTEAGVQFEREDA